METHLKPLTSITVVSRAATAIRDFERLMNELFDPTPLWTIAKVCDRCPPGSVRLLGRVKAREDPSIGPLLKRSNFAKGVEKAIKANSLAIVQWLVEKYLPEGRIRGPMHTAVMYRRLEILTWLHVNHNSRVIWYPSVVVGRALFGDLKTIKWLHENVAPIDREKKAQLMRHFVHNGFSEYGFDEIVVWLHSLGLPFVQPDLTAAVATGNIALVKWIVSNTHPQIEEELIVEAVCSGELEMVRWLYTTFGFSVVSADVIVDGIKRIAARYSDACFNHEFIVWTLDHLTISNTGNLAKAFDVLCARGAFEDITRIQAISSGGRCSTAAMDMAAGNGRLDLVRWLHENRNEGCTARAMDGAAESGFLDVAKWLHNFRHEGCTVHAMDSAAENGHLETIQWLHHNRSEGCTTKAMDSAAANGHLDILKWLHQHRDEGCSTDVMDSAAANGHLDTVKWIHEYRSEGCTFAAMDNASKNGHLKTVKWLCNNRCEGCVDTAIYYADQSRHFEVARFLRRQMIVRSGDRHDAHCLRTSTDTKLEYIAEILKRSEDISTHVGSERALSVAIDKFSSDEISWFLTRLPDYQFSSAPMKRAIQRNKLDIALLLAQDGRFPCDRECYFASAMSEPELFQWLVRDFSNAIPELRNARRFAASSPFLLDALHELDQLRDSD